MRVVVTGAAGVLGRAVVDAFAARGDDVAALDRFAGELAHAGVRQIESGDLTDPLAAAGSIGEAVNALGGVDVLVNLVGAFAWHPIGQSTVDTWRALFAANVETALNAIQACLPKMSYQGSIICVGAASAQPAGLGMAPYAATKSGVARLVEALSAELKPRRIRVNAVLPAIIDTPRNRADMPDANPENWTTPQAIAEVILFLAGQEARAINGASIPVTNNA
jgi:NAD(P)-dependent dehydrogenase (short-subunit alcohol dehydrogenase family)